jgi:hypothetical protein
MARHAWIWQHDTPTFCGARCMRDGCRARLRTIEVAPGRNNIGYVGVRVEFSPDGGSTWQAHRDPCPCAFPGPATPLGSEPLPISVEAGGGV